MKFSLVFPGEVHWSTRCPMFAGDAVFPDEVHWGTRCPMFAGDAVFPGEVHWGTRWTLSIFLCFDVMNTRVMMQLKEKVKQLIIMTNLPYDLIRLIAIVHACNGQFSN